MENLNLRFGKMRSGASKFIFTAAGQNVVGTIWRSRKGGRTISYTVSLDSKIDGIRFNYLQVFSVLTNTTKAYTEAQNFAGKIARRIHQRSFDSVGEQLQLF